ncbi:MAG: rod shape-determining protein MreC [Rheinheimera sp.]|nr:rod shape-determining protein MreC [Rheinheimera sp.]
MQRPQFLQQENDKLRALLGAISPVTEGKRLIAEVLAVYSHPFSHQIVLNKGSNDGVTVGQPLLDDLGVLGQIVSVGPASSRALLIVDNTHAISGRIERTGLSVVAEGIGQADTLRLDSSSSTDIHRRKRPFGYVRFRWCFPGRLSDRSYFESAT